MIRKFNARPSNTSTKKNLGKGEFTEAALAFLRDTKAGMAKEGFPNETKMYIARVFPCLFMYFYFTISFLVAPFAAIAVQGISGSTIGPLTGSRLFR